MTNDKTKKVYDFSGQGVYASWDVKTSVRMRTCSQLVLGCVQERSSESKITAAYKMKI